MSKIMRTVRQLSLLLALCPVAAQAQNSWPTPAGPSTVGVVQMCLNGSGLAVPVSSGQCALGEIVVVYDQNGNPVDYTTPTFVTQSSLAPTGAVPVSNSSGDVTAAVATAALGGVSGKTTYVSGISISGGGATGASGIVCTLAGVVTGTMTFIYSVGVLTAGSSPFVVPFYPPLAASTTNTAITLSCPSFGVGNLHASTNIWGYQQ